MSTRKLKIAAGSSYTRQKRAWRQVDVDYAVTLEFDAEAIDYKETHLVVEQLTGDTEVNFTDVSSSFVGDQVFAYFEADGSIRTVTFGDNIAGFVADFDVPANTKVCCEFAFDGTDFVYKGATSGSFAAPAVYETGTGITAHAGGGQGSAVALTKEYNHVGTCATAADSVKLPAAVLGTRCVVFNDGAADLAVFPTTGDTINDGSANASVTVAVGATVEFVADGSTNWETNNQAVNIYGDLSVGDDLDVTDDATIGGDLLFGGIFKSTGTPQTLTGAGAVNLTAFSTLLVTTGADALTLAAGAEGQFKFIRMKTDGGDGTLTVTNLQGGTTLTFDDAGDFVLLFYQDAKWHIIVNSGATLA